MNSKLLLTLAGTAITVIALSGCSASGTPSASTPTVSASPTTVAAVDAATATNSLGEIVVDGNRMTAYVFDEDVANSGKSACVAACAAIWPAITSTTATPVVTGITGTVSTITGVSGVRQITINGLPIYTFSKDAAPGDVKGQGFKGIWHALTPAGVKITTPAAG
ncbi:MAG: COG4315 family predicted lipoprotein [Lacisediminihabitans sp.]